MHLHFKINQPCFFSKKDKNAFLKLLIKQGQVESPNLTKINDCHLLGMAYMNGKPIGIAAIKGRQDKPFDYANVPEMKAQYGEYELGYGYVESECRGLSISGMILILLLKKLGTKDVFGVTEMAEKNPIRHFLVKKGFTQIGETYKGKCTGNPIGLFLKLGKETTNGVQYNHVSQFSSMNNSKNGLVRQRAS